MDATEAAAVREHLGGERARIEVLRVALAHSFADIVASAELANIDDEHDPEGSTIAFERQQVAALLKQAERDLADLDEAAARLDAGTVDQCESCGTAIPVERLLALPTTRRCVGCAEPGRGRRAGQP